MKHFYIAVTEQVKGKNYSYWITATESDNILSKLTNPNIIHANIFSSRTKADQIVDLWNKSYKINGSFMFS